ncbi:MAG: NYN domain-containing protein [Coriobacteriales bacterium]|jgi:predicted RNA-binding protein with PIN domain|nr:NYN domain-containing protein [Coriobacteriales bacterium]
MRLLLVDGYNVLRSGSAYAHLTEGVPDHTHDAFNVARQALVTDVATFAGREYEATVVFDGGGNPHSTGEARKVAGIQVVFSSAGVSADSVIEELARAAAGQGREVLVVTSDAATQWTVLGRKVTRMSAAGFAEEMQGIRRDIEEAVCEQAGKRTLAGRLDEDVRAALERMARGGKG